MNEAKTQKSQTAKNGNAKASKHPRNNDKLFYMKFYPDHIDDLRDHLCRALKLKTHAELPVYFRSPYAFPAAIGLRTELEKRYNVETGSEEHELLIITLKRYFRSPKYSNAMCDMPKRYGLDMEPADEVQDGDRTIYQMRLKHHIKAVTERRKQESENSQSDASLKIPAAITDFSGMKCPDSPMGLGKPIQTDPV